MTLKMELEKAFSRNSLCEVGKVFIQSYKDFLRDSGPQWAAAIAYYSLLSIFPLLLAATAIAAYFVDPQWAIQQGARLIGDFIPGGVQFIREIVQGILQTRGRVGLFSILVLIWSGSRVFGVVTKALNIAYHVSEPYTFFKRTLVELLMTLTIGILFVLALGPRLLIGFLENTIPLPTLEQAVLLQILGYAAHVLLLLTSLFLTYKYVPRRKVEWWAALAGSIMFTVLFLVAQPLFTGYIATFANYNLVYGPLAVVITLVLWTWISANFLILGGELVAHIQDMLIEHKSEQEVEEEHKQRDPTDPEHDELNK
jgi:membrane protein